MPKVNDDVAEAMTQHCGLCHAAPGERCRNICTGAPLPLGQCHFYRLKTISGAK